MMLQSQDTYDIDGPSRYSFLSLVSFVSFARAAYVTWMYLCPCMNATVILYVSCRSLSIICSIRRPLVRIMHGKNTSDSSPVYRIRILAGSNLPFMQLETKSNVTYLFLSRFSSNLSAVILISVFAANGKSYAQDMTERLSRFSIYTRGHPE